MAEFAEVPVIELTVLMRLKESEIRALEALTGYNENEFLKVFYEHMGQSYLKPHEGGLRSLFKSIREGVPSILRRVDDARKVFKGEK